MKKILLTLIWGLLMAWFVSANSPVMCIEVYAPVCWVKDWIIKTYSNSCFAKGNWAKILHAGACTWMEKYNMIKKLKYVVWKTKTIIDDALNRYFKKLSKKSLPEQLNILQEKVKKIDKVREQLEKTDKLSDFIWEVLFYIQFKFEEKISELKAKLTWWKNNISQSLLESVLQETSWK